jgi:hypothetical protein
MSKNHSVKLQKVSFSYQFILLSHLNIIHIQKANRRKYNRVK